eukprot:s5700_g3.t1
MRIVSFLQGQCRFADVSQPSNETEIRGKNGWDVNQVTLKCSWLRVCKAEDVAGLIDRDSQRVSKSHGRAGLELPSAALRPFRRSSELSIRAGFGGALLGISLGILGSPEAAGGFRQLRGPRCRGGWFRADCLPLRRADEIGKQKPRNAKPPTRANSLRSLQKPMLRASEKLASADPEVANWLCKAESAIIDAEKFRQGCSTASQSLMTGIKELLADKMNWKVLGKFAAYTAQAVAAVVPLPPPLAAAVEKCSNWLLSTLSQTAQLSVAQLEDRAGKASEKAVAEEFLRLGVAQVRAAQVQVQDMSMMDDLWLEEMKDTDSQTASLIIQATSFNRWAVIEQDLATSAEILRPPSSVVDMEERAKSQVIGGDPPDGPRATTTSSDVTRPRVSKPSSAPALPRSAAVFSASAHPWGTMAFGEQGQSSQHQDFARTT